MQYVHQSSKVARAEALPIPANTVKMHSTPNEVRIGDFVLLDGRYQRIRDMRSAGTASVRVLHFVGRPPWVMRKARTIFRPI
ncbi:hypothetical protein [Streptomyces huasconensis]|uniref:hypothetical protein n=1 Tax=Streptomyces huasconensis TaxID=1854574 RepID=UPI0036FCBA45